uniref:Transmembrane protein n=1 Tax=Strongyloides stercoralis TaxID=6248 RepID=A0A0K0ECF9_STRER
MIIQGPDGQKFWKEISQLTLPKGGKKLTFITKNIVAIGACVIAFGYFSFQAEANPNSIYGRTYEKLITYPLKTLKNVSDPLSNIGIPENEKSE